MLLATDASLPAKYVDHAPRGEGKDFRICHVKPDLVLISAHFACSDAGPRGS